MIVTYHDRHKLGHGLIIYRRAATDEVETPKIVSALTGSFIPHQ